MTVRDIDPPLDRISTLLDMADRADTRGDHVLSTGLIRLLLRLPGKDAATTETTP